MDEDITAAATKSWKRQFPPLMLLPWALASAAAIILLLPQARNSAAVTNATMDFFLSLLLTLQTPYSKIGGWVELRSQAHALAAMQAGKEQLAIGHL